MELKDLLAKLAEFDEMEQQDGMNIVEGEEEFDDERSENKRKARIYKKAVIALEELQDLLEEGIDPATGKLDDETDAFYNSLTGVINEIDSRALAFDESFSSKKESAMEDAYEYLVEYADNEGLNVSDLIDYDPAEIAEWISDRMGREVTAQEIEELIEEETHINYEDLDEAVILNDKLTRGNNVKSELFQIGIAVNKFEEDVYLGTVSYGPRIKRLSTTDYAGEDVVADVTAIVKENLDKMEADVKNLLNLI